MKGGIAIILVAASWLAALTLAQYSSTCGYTPYDPSEYICEHDELKPINATLDVPFIVTAVNPTAPFDGKTFEACAGRFLLGPEDPCTICHPRIPRERCSPGTKTVFKDNDELFVGVPGGQRYYIEPNGALRYGYRTDDILSGVTAFANGTFTYEGLGWLACPIDSEGPNQQFEIFVKLPDLFFITICFPFEAIASPTSTIGAAYFFYTTQ